MSNDSMKWKVNLKNLYGELSAGKYRAGIGIMDYRGVGDFEEQNYYAEFEIAG